MHALVQMRVPISGLAVDQGLRAGIAAGLVVTGVVEQEHLLCSRVKCFQAALVRFALGSEPTITSTSGSVSSMGKPLCHTIACFTCPEAVAMQDKAFVRIWCNALAAFRQLAEYCQLLIQVSNFVSTLTQLATRVKVNVDVKLCVN